MSKPEHLKYYENLEPEAKDTRKHHLDDHVRIDHKWTTPFFEMDGVLPKKMRDDLCRVLEKKELDMKAVKEKEPEFYSIAQSKGFYATTHYNLFAEEDMNEFPNEKESILAYEKLAMEQIRYYIRKGWGVQQADDMRLEGRCFGNVQSASDQQGGAQTTTSWSGPVIKTWFTSSFISRPSPLYQLSFLGKDLCGIAESRTYTHSSKLCLA